MNDFCIVDEVTSTFYVFHMINKPPEFLDAIENSNLTSDPTQSFASLLSQSTRPDQLPTRILYPASEYSYNAANVPTGISPYTSLIFWAH